MHRNDGGIVDAELLRPCSWISRHRIEAGKLLPMSIEELQVYGSAMVTSIDRCPEIASGEGSVVTARFITREVNTIARVVVARLSESCASDPAPAITPYTPAELRYLATLGLVDLETIEGTPIHPIWSMDRRDWVPLGDLTEGETLQAADGSALVVSVTIDDHLVPVYNIEVHGEHVYQVGAFGLLVHNTYLNAPNKVPLPKVKGIGKVDDLVPTHVPKNWSKADIMDAVDTYRHSIAVRKAEAAAFEAAGGGHVWARKAHFERIVQEENFLRQMLKRLEDM